MYLFENYLLYSAPQHNSLDFSRGQLEDITVQNYSIMCAAKTSGSTELQYTVPKRNILLACTCLIEFWECQQGHSKQRNLTDVLHAEQWSTAMLYPYLLEWNIFPARFFYSASSCLHISQTHELYLCGWSGQLTQLGMPIILLAAWDWQHIKGTEHKCPWSSPVHFWNDFQPFHTSLHNQQWLHPPMDGNLRKRFRQVLECWAHCMEQTGCF